MASNGGDIRDYEGVDKMTAAMTPLVAVREEEEFAFLFVFHFLLFRASSLSSPTLFFSF